MTEHAVHAWLRARLAEGHFGHREHLKLVWLAIDEVGPEAAGDLVAKALHAVAAAHGETARYHETLTRFWVWVVVLLRGQHPGLPDVDAAVKSFPHLLDKDLPLRHWSRAEMWSGHARREWTEPDLLPLPR